MNGTDANTPRPTPRRFRFRFNLLTLLLVMTAACFFAAWWFMPRPVEIVALVYARNFGALSTSLDSETGSKLVLSEEVEVQRKRLTDLANSVLVIGRALREPKTYDAASALAPKSDDLETWLKERIEIDFPSGGEIMRWSLTVDEKHADEGCKVLDAVLKVFLEEWRSGNRNSSLRRYDELVAYHSQLTQRAETLRERLQSGDLSETQAQIMRLEIENVTNEAAEVGLRIQAADRARRSRSLEILQPATVTKN